MVLKLIKKCKLRKNNFLIEKNLGLTLLSVIVIDDINNTTRLSHNVAPLAALGLKASAPLSATTGFYFISPRHNFYFSWKSDKMMNWMILDTWYFGGWGWGLWESWIWGWMVLVLIDFEFVGLNEENKSCEMGSRVS